jgi:hypothetical protein
MAVTPMLAALMSVMSPSGIEIAGSVCFTAGLIRFAAGDAHQSPQLPALALAVGGTALAIVRPLGPIWLLALLALSLPFGSRVAREGASKGVLVVVAIVLSVAISIAIGWSMGERQHLVASPNQIVQAIPNAFADVPRTALEQIGWFGWVDTPVPGAVYALWLTALAFVLAIAIIVGTPHERIALIVVVICAGIVMVVLDAMLMVPLRQHIQGRDAMPVSIAIPLWGSEIVYRHRRRFASILGRWHLFSTSVGIAFVHLASWWIAARRHSVGINGPWLFPSAVGAWSPPTGWPLLIIVAVSAGVLLVIPLLRHSAVGEREVVAS